MNETRATRYQRLRRRAHAAGLASAGLMLAVVALTPLSRQLASLAERFARGLPSPFFAIVAVAVFAVLVVVLWELAALPSSVYLARRVDERYGHAHNATSVEDAMAAQAHAALIALPVALVAAAIWLVSVRVAGGVWWIVAGALAAAAIAAALRAGPALLAFVADTRPLANPALTDRLRALARRARVPVTSIEEWRVTDDAAPTALVAGLGRSRRVLIAAPLLRDWSEDEVMVVVAHELAHHANGDLGRSAIVDAGIVVAALGVAHLAAVTAAPWLQVSGPADLAAVPLMVLVAGAIWIAATPLRHALSRRDERRADTYALALTGGVDAFTAAIRRLGERHLAEEHPSRLTRLLYYRHPSVAERLALAEAFKRIREMGDIRSGDRTMAEHGR